MAKRLRALITDAGRLTGEAREALDDADALLESLAAAVAQGCLRGTLQLELPEPAEDAAPLERLVYRLAQRAAIRWTIDLPRPADLNATG